EPPAVRQLLETTVGEMDVQALSNHRDVGSASMRIRMIGIGLLSIMAACWAVPASAAGQVYMYRGRDGRIMFAHALDSRGAASGRAGDAPAGVAQDSGSPAVEQWHNTTTEMRELERAADLPIAAF